jgi:N-acetylmuramoyl-L-alanine amidase
MSLILDTGPSNPVPISQNLFTTYEQRSYTCKVTMLGDAMIQPTQYFMLENIPMFAGLYLITKVNHSIAGETNSMTTDFEGVRLPKEPRPFVTKPYDVYAKSFLDISTIDPVFETSSRGNTSSGSNLEKKNRTIYLVAGHSFSKEINEPGAVYKIPGTNEYKEEREFTRELRNLIKNRLDSKSIKNEIDDDSLALKYIIPDLRSKVTEDDIVIDIHFNSQENPDQTTGNFASGTEVIIKDRKNDEIIKIGKAIASTINNVLNVGLRHIEGTTTPQELDRRLGIFDLNAKVFLIEVCFLSNPDEYRVYESKKEELAISLAILISELSITENDKTLQTIETYTIFNTLRYDNLNNRQNPYIIPLDSESTFKTLIKKFEFTKVYQYNSYTATNLKFAYENNLNLYKDNIIDQINLTSGKYGLDALFLGGILSIESVSFDPLSVSDGDAIGLGQFTFNGAMPEVLGYMIDNKEEITSVITYNYNSFVFTSKKYGDIVNLLFENNPIDRDKFYYNKFRTYLEETKTSNGTPYIRILVNKIFDNPFIMIEMVGIYLRILEKKYVGTVQNKNAAILAFSYNVGIHKLTNKNSEKPYFDHLRDYYNDTTKQEIKNKIVGNVENEGIKYPERLLDEYLIKFIQTLSKDKSKLF